LPEFSLIQILNSSPPWTNPYSFYLNPPNYRQFIIFPDKRQGWTCNLF